MIKYPRPSSYSAEQVKLALRYFHCYVLQEKLRLKHNKETIPYRAQIEPTIADYRAGKLTESEMRAIVVPVMAPLMLWRRLYIDPDHRQIQKELLENRGAIKDMAGEFTVELGDLTSGS